MKAVGYKGRLGCIEILKAKAAIMFDRFCMNKAQQEVESQRKRGRKRQQWKNKLQYIIAPVILQLMIEGRRWADRVPLTEHWWTEWNQWLKKHVITYLQINDLVCGKGEWDLTNRDKDRIADFYPSITTTNYNHCNYYYYYLFGKTSQSYGSGYISSQPKI